uniref:Uncharacterized protein n=1 Tax=Hemiselmis andersenii TaxID=464988 RepID=A0A7S1GST5_HEMAN|mmetsp:Transcript_14243/g.34691  ORF Transcript_14243/g.34691 Transcript_14243/m.34691 type:complete len:397 (+) Transcript_14243:166-1356(+)
MVDAAIEDAQVYLSRIWAKTEDTVAGVGAAVFMPFIQPLETFKPDGEGLDEDSEDEDVVKTGKKKPDELRKGHDARNKQLLEAAFKGTLHLQMDYAFEQKRLQGELVREQDMLQKEKDSIQRKVPGWETIKAKEVLASKESKMNFLDTYMPPKLIKGKVGEDKKLAQVGFIDDFFKQKKRIRDSRKKVERIKGELSRLEDENPESKTVLQYLLEEHAEVNVVNQDGFTPLMLAARNGHLESVRVLMEAPHIEVGKKNALGSNAMHYAAMYAHKEIVALLRAGVAGNKINKRDKNNMDKTPMDLANTEHQLLVEHKEAMWEKVYKEKKFLLVGEMKPKDIPDNPVYNALGIHDPGTVAPPKKFKANRYPPRAAAGGGACVPASCRLGEDKSRATKRA